LSLDQWINHYNFILEWNIETLKWVLLTQKHSVLFLKIESHGSDLQVQRLGSCRRHVFNERHGLKIKTFLGGSFPHVRSGQLSSVCVLVTLKWFMGSFNSCCFLCWWVCYVFVLIELLLVCWFWTEKCELFWFWCSCLMMVDVSF
jgi:hypothetical protein